MTEFHEGAQKLQDRPMPISGKKFAITGAGRGLGAALAIAMADSAAKLVLLARDKQALMGTAAAIERRTGQIVDTLTCDLASAADCAEAGDTVARRHPDLDGLIHNGAMWLAGSLTSTPDADIHDCISSAAIGSLILTRHLLPVLSARPSADLHFVVSTSGLPNAQLSGTSVAFRAAKAAQDALVQGLGEELKQTPVRVTAVYPDDFVDVSPLDPAWDYLTESGASLSTRAVVDSIVFILNLPAGATVRSLVIQ